MEKKKFAAATLDLEHETYVVYIKSVSLVILPSSFLLNMHSFCRPQMASLIAKKASTKVFTKYLDFADIFSSDLAFKLLEYIGINNHAIKLVDSQ